MKRKKIENRIDDDLIILEKRIEGYFRETRPIIEKLNELSDILYLNAIGDINIVSEKLKKALRHII